MELAQELEYPQYIAQIISTSWVDLDQGREYWRFLAIPAQPLRSPSFTQAQIFAVKKNGEN